MLRVVSLIVFIKACNTALPAYCSSSSNSSYNVKYTLFITFRTVNFYRNISYVLPASHFPPFEFEHLVSISQQHLASVALLQMMQCQKLELKKQGLLERVVVQTRLL